MAEPTILRCDEIHNPFNTNHLTLERVIENDIEDKYKYTLVFLPTDIYIKTLKDWAESSKRETCKSNYNFVMSSLRNYFYKISIKEKRRQFVMEREKRRYGRRKLKRQLYHLKHQK